MKTLATNELQEIHYKYDIISIAQSEVEEFSLLVKDLILRISKLRDKFIHEQVIILI